MPAAGDQRRQGVEEAVVARAFQRRADAADRGQRVAAQLERRRDVDRAVERAGDHPARHRRPADRRRRRAPQRRGLAEADEVGGGEGDHPRNQGRGQRRAAGERPQQPQQLVGVDAGRVDGEDEQDDDDPQGQRRALGQRFERHVDLAQHRHRAEPGQHGVAAVGDQPVDGDHQQRTATPQRRVEEHGAPHPRGDPDQTGRQPRRSRARSGLKR